MGMYNEVFKNCPECGCQCTMQIHQVVLGFGGFFLDSPKALEDFTIEQLTEVRDAVKDRLFYCGECGHNFYAIPVAFEEKHKQIKALFGI